MYMQCAWVTHPVNYEITFKYIQEHKLKEDYEWIRIHRTANRKRNVNGNISKRRPSKLLHKLDTFNILCRISSISSTKYLLLLPIFNFRFASNAHKIQNMITSCIRRWHIRRRLHRMFVALLPVSCILSYYKQ